MSTETVNPSTGRRIRSHTKLGLRGIERAVASSASAFATRRAFSFAESARVFRSVSALWMR